MPIKIEITGESMGDIELALNALHRPDPRTMPLTDLWKITQERFGVEGFIVTATAQGSVAGTPITAAEAVAQEAATVLADPEASEEEIDNAAEELVRAREQIDAGKSPKTAAKIAAIEEALDAAVLPARRKKTTVTKKPVPEAVPAAVDNGDRAYVLDELTKRFADPKQKTQAKSFIDKIAGRHGGVRLSRLEPELFPKIREEMIVEFGLAGSNGHAGA